MVWLCLFVAIALVAIGGEAMYLANRSTPLTDREFDELVVGKNQPPLSEASRDYLRGNLFAQMFLYPQFLGGAFVAAGLAFGVLAFRLWLSST